MRAVNCGFGGVILFLLLTMPVHAELCTVDSVVDGDTLMVRCDRYNEKFIGMLRLKGIDSPEIGQSYGANAKTFLEGMVTGKQLSVSAIDTSTKMAEITVNGGANLSYALVMNGLAWSVKRDKNSNNTLLKYEDRAKAAHAGLWANDKAIPPWEYRSKNRIIDDEDKLFATIDINAPNTVVTDCIGLPTYEKDICLKKLGLEAAMEIVDTREDCNQYEPNTPSRANCLSRNLDNEKRVVNRYAR